MCQIVRFLQLLATLFPILINSFTDSVRILLSLISLPAVLAAENLFLRKSLAFYQEHQIRPRRLTAAARFRLLVWSRFCDWTSALLMVKPETLIGWHRKGFKLFWKCYVAHYNKGRPRSSLGLAFRQRHRLQRDWKIRVEDIFGGLHHEYWLEKGVA